MSATNYTTDNVADDLLVLQEGQSALLPIEIAIIMDKYSGDLGNLLDNILTGNSRNNTLNGENGVDTLYGNNGDDTLQKLLSEVNNEVK